MAIYGLSNLGGNAGMYGGIYGGGGLYSLIGAFSPYDYDPSLYFDAQESMLSAMQNPTLDLDPSKPDTLNVITATRSGVATYTDAAGLIQSASADTVRVDHVDGVPMILVEPSATNLVPTSVPNSNWSVQGATITENFSTSPEGQQTATKVIKSGDSQNDRTFIESLAIASGTEYTVSVYLKNIDVANHTTVGVRITSGTLFRIKYQWDSGVIGSLNGTSYNRFAVDVGDGWYRVGFTFTADGTSTGIEVDVDRDSGTYTDTSSILLWGAQLELGPVSTSFIKTTSGAVTRAADDYKIVGSDFSDFYNQSEGTIYVEFVPKEVTTVTFIYEASDTSNERIYSRVGSSDSLKVSDGETQASITAGTASLVMLNRLAASFKQNNFQVAVNGTAGTPDISGSLPSVTFINIGSNFAGGNQLNGHIKRMIYWPYHSDSL